MFGTEVTKLKDVLPVGLSRLLIIPPVDLYGNVQIWLTFYYGNLNEKKNKLNR